MDEKDVLTPDFKKVFVGGRIYKVGKLSLRQFLMLTKLIAKALGKKEGTFDKLASKVGVSTSNNQDMTTILELIDPDDVMLVLAAILREDDVSFIEENLDIDTTSEIIAIVCEANSFEVVKKNMLRITKVMGTA